MKTGKSRLAALAVILFCGLCGARAEGETNIIMGPGYQPGQQSKAKLAYAVPEGWRSDEAAARKLGLYAVLVPPEATVDTAGRLITVAFQRKDPGKPGLDTLENFVRVDLQNTLGQFPDTQFARWQPPGIDPDRVRFWSIELWGKVKDQPSPQHVLIIDAGDGYFSVSATDGTLDALRRPLYEDFFNSISLAEGKGPAK